MGRNLCHVRFTSHSSLNKSWEPSLIPGWTGCKHEKLSSTIQILRFLLVHFGNVVHICHRLHYTQQTHKVCPKGFLIVIVFFLLTSTPPMRIWNWFSWAILSLSAFRNWRQAKEKWKKASSSSKEMSKTAQKPKPFQSILQSIPYMLLLFVYFEVITKISKKKIFSGHIPYGITFRHISSDHTRLARMYRYGWVTIALWIL